PRRYRADEDNVVRVRTGVGDLDAAPPAAEGASGVARVAAGASSGRPALTAGEGQTAREVAARTAASAAALVVVVSPVAARGGDGGVSGAAEAAATARTERAGLPRRQSGRATRSSGDTRETVAAGAADGRRPRPAPGAAVGRTAARTGIVTSGRRRARATDAVRTTGTAAAPRGLVGYRPGAAGVLYRTDRRRSGPAAGRDDRAGGDEPRIAAGRAAGAGARCPERVRHRCARRRRVGRRAVVTARATLAGRAAALTRAPQ